METGKPDIKAALKRVQAYARFCISNPGTDDRIHLEMIEEMLEQIIYMIKEG